MAYKHGNFVWFELVTSDIGKARAFYPETVGWGTSEMDMGEFKYTMLTRNDAPHAGVVNAKMEGVPNHWASYVSVPDVDGAAKLAGQHGGKVIAEPFDIPSVGRACLVADPQGATLFLFKSAEGDDSGSDAFHWNELWAKDAEAVLPFYEKVIGYTIAQMPMGDMTYYIFKHGDRSCGGAMTSPIAEAPAMWLPYIAVDDADAAIARAQRNGGQIKKPADDVQGVGRFGIIADNAGAVVGVIRPAAAG
jgi:predicted enzyme related to lactoylglutathione lyase